VRGVRECRSEHVTALYASIVVHYTLRCGELSRKWQFWRHTSDGQILGNRRWWQPKAHVPLMTPHRACRIILADCRGVRLLTTAGSTGRSLPDPTGAPPIAPLPPLVEIPL
jgi:hypothetical protein